MKKHIKCAIMMLLVFGILASATCFAPEVFALPSNSIYDNCVVGLEAEISLTDHPASFSEEYTIVLKAENNRTPMPSGSVSGISEQKRIGAGTVEFGDIEYSAPGIYSYTVYQVEGSADRWTYDSSVYEVTVYVTHNDDNTEAYVNTAIHKTGETEKTDKMVFLNEYSPLPVAVSISAIKTMDGKAPENGAFNFVLRNDDGTEAEVVSNTDGIVSFTDLVFETQGVYTYTVSEVKGTDRKITYDKTVYTLEITVTQDGDLVANVGCLKNGKAYDGDLVFANVTGPVMGDNANLGLWIGIFAVSAAVIVLLLVLGRKRKQ